MSTNEVMALVNQWLEDMNYDGKELVIEELVQGEFGKSLAFIVQHLFNRRDTAFVKRELYRLRESADRVLSNPRRKELGLHHLDFATRENTRLKNNDQLVSSLLVKVLNSLDIEGKTKSQGMDSLLKARILLARLNDSVLDCEESKERYLAISKQIDEWRITFEDGKETSTIIAIEQILNSLLDHASDNFSTKQASPSSLEEIAKLQRALSAQLRELISRHSRIRPPPIEIHKSTLLSLRAHCHVLSNISTVAPKSSPDGRQELIESILRLREHRQGMELIIGTELKNVDSLELLRNAEKSLEEIITSTQNMLQFRANLRARILSLKNDFQSQPSLSSLQDQIRTHNSETLSSVDSNITSILSNYAQETVVPSAIPSSLTQDSDPILISEITRALNIVHLLNSQPNLSEPVSELDIARGCDALAESRFAMESLKNSLEDKVAIEIPMQQLEELVDLRDQFMEGKFLPTIRMKDGKTLLEKYRKLERESNRKQIL